MKIYGLCVVRNEDDIIETFIKYHSFLDYLFITDNGSTDRTCEIIQSVMQSSVGPQIVLLHHNVDFDQENITAGMLERIMSEEFAPKPDLIIPLDADELIATDEGNSIRHQLESIDQTVVSSIKWRTYIPISYGSETYMPRKFRHCRKQELEYLSKVIIPANLIDSSFRILRGSHTIYSKKNVTITPIENIFMAHYPVRSVYQITKKTITGYAKRISSASYTIGASKQAERLFEQFLTQGRFCEENLMEEAYRYFSAYEDSYSADKLEEHPIDLSDSVTNLEYTLGDGDLVMALTNDLMCMAYSLREIRKEIISGCASVSTASHTDCASERIEEMRLKKNIALEEANASAFDELEYSGRMLTGKKVWVCTYSIVGEKICQFLSENGVCVEGIISIHSVLAISGWKECALSPIKKLVLDCDCIVVYTEAMHSYMKEQLSSYPWVRIVRVKPVRGKNESSNF